MISFAYSVLGILAATFVPVYISLYLVSNLGFIHTRYVAAAGFGLTFWFFFDTMNDTGQLDVNDSFGGGAYHVGILLAFAFGIVALALFDYFAVPRSAGIQIDPDATKTFSAVTGSIENSRSKVPRNSYLLFLIPAAVAAVMGIHGLGEGWDFGTAAHLATTQNLIEAFGGLSAVASYPLHKFLEAAIIATVYVAYVKRTDGNLRARAAWQIPLLGVLFALPSVIGTSIGYIVSFDTTFFYSFGVTAALYAAIRLVDPIRLNFKIGVNAPTYLGWKVFLAVLVGFLLLYGAALFH